MAKLALAIAILCIGFCALPAAISSTPKTPQFSSSRYHQASNLQLSEPNLSRKLESIDEEASNNQYGGKGRSNAYQKQENTISGSEKRRYTEKMVRGGRGGTWAQAEGTGDKSEYFTMDYTPPRRRQPIHNEFVPVVGP